MREILFRGKYSKKSPDWIEGSFHRDEDTNICEIAYRYYKKEGETKAGIWVYGVVDPETVGQYTGLKDKNGKKIFEGDIFKFDDEVWESSYTSCGTEYDSFAVENYGVVGFDEDMARFDFIKYKFNENSVEADLHENHNIDFSEFVSELEVIGNIYDNPELIGR